MNLEVTFGSALCYTSSFTVNDVEADESDFGRHYDHDPGDAKDYCCGDMRFDAKDATPEILAKYRITLEEYAEICNQLDQGLSFGDCGWCS